MISQRGHWSCIAIGAFVNIVGVSLFESSRKIYLTHSCNRYHTSVFWTVFYVYFCIQGAALGSFIPPPRSNQSVSWRPFTNPPPPHILTFYVYTTTTYSYLLCIHHCHIFLPFTNPPPPHIFTCYLSTFLTSTTAHTSPFVGSNKSRSVICICISSTTGHIHLLIIHL